MVVAATDDLSAGPAIRRGEQTALETLRGVAAALRNKGVGSEITVVDGPNFTLEHLRQRLSTMLTKVTQSDTVVFYYIGHGENAAGGSFPMLRIHSQSGSEIGITEDDVADLIDGARPRLAIVIAEACNSYRVSSDAAIAPQPNEMVLANTSLEDEALELFWAHSGRIVIASASPGEVAVASSLTGPIFTSRFFSEMRSAMKTAAETSTFTRWKPLLQKLRTPVQGPTGSQTPIIFTNNLRFSG